MSDLKEFAAAVYAKTPQGQQEIQTRSLGLAPLVPRLLVLVDGILTKAEGNPFYMEELVRMLMDQGAIRTGGPASERWTLDAERLSATRVPATLTGVSGRPTRASAGAEMPRRPCA